MVQSKNAFGDVPISRLPFIGSPFDLRGYYVRQYRDNSGHEIIPNFNNITIDLEWCFNTFNRYFYGRGGNFKV